MADYHLGENNELPFVPLELWATTHITTWEEEKMGIPREKTKMWREQYQVFDSDDVGFIREETRSGNNSYDESESENDNATAGEREESTSRSRKRAISVLTTASESRNRSPTKKQNTSN